jgi:hypothetical protein
LARFCARRGAPLCACRPAGRVAHAARNGWVLASANPPRSCRGSQEARHGRPLSCRNRRANAASDSKGIGCPRRRRTVHPEFSRVAPEVRAPRLWSRRSKQATDGTLTSLRDRHAIRRC